jgi:5-formyltetrahydrofolate cyclo-ligase
MILESIEASLSVLRQQLRQARRALSEQQQAEHAQHLAQTLLTLIPASRSFAIGVTAAFDGEIDPLPTVKQLQAAGHQTYLPILRADKQLDFALWQPDSLMLANQFGILEPQDVARVSVDALDVLLVPLVGVDRSGNRLGMGGGYYDRTLGSASKCPYLMGIAHHCQLVDQLPIQPWDIPLDMLITEKTVIIWHQFNKEATG